MRTLAVRKWVSVRVSMLACCCDSGEREHVLTVCDVWVCVCVCLCAYFILTFMSVCLFCLRIQFICALHVHATNLLCSEFSNFTSALFQMHFILCEWVCASHSYIFHESSVPSSCVCCYSHAVVCIYLNVVCVRYVSEYWCMRVVLHFSTHSHTHTATANALKKK